MDYGIKKYDENHYNNEFLIVICAAIAFLIFARDVVGIGINMYIIMALSIIGMPFLHIQISSVF